MGNHFADLKLREVTHKEWDILQDEIKDLQDEIGVYKDEQDEHIDELFDILDVDDIDDIVPAVKALKAKNE